MRVRWRRRTRMPEARIHGSASRRTGRAWLCLAVLLLVVGVVAAQEAPKGVPQPGAVLRDDEFGVGTRRFGLEREVEMYQWRAGNDGYLAVWNSARIDSSGFAAGHENPATIPMQSRRWWAEGATLDGHPIDPQVLRVLGTWQRFRPNFSRLPANLAASFQPEGDGLGSSENPLAPQVGDLRVHWRELVLPTLADKTQLRDGVWRLTAEAATVRTAPGPVIDIPVVSDLPVQAWWPWLAAGAAMAAAAWLRLRRRRRRGAVDQDACGRRPACQPRGRPPSAAYCLVPKILSPASPRPGRM